MTQHAATPQTPNGSASIGIEIMDGGMRLLASRLTDNATLGRRWHRRLKAPPTPEEAITALNDLIDEVIAETSATYPTPETLGVALCGDVDAPNGVTLGMSHAPGWENFPLANRLAARLEIPVFLMSAVAAAGLAEATAGAGQRHREVLYLHNARTVASAWIVEGGVMSGESGRSGKLGHWLVAPDGPRCACGMRGHLDPIASSQAIVRTTIGLAAGSDESTAAMLRVSGGRAEAMTVRQVVQLGAEGESTAQHVLDQAWDALASVLANLVAALDPGIIVLGGPPAEAGEGFIGPLRERLNALCNPWRPAPEIVAGALEPHAALLGACLLPYNQWHDR